MTPDSQRHARIGELFHEALAQPSTERPQFLSQACGNDPAMLAEVRELLAVDGELDSTVFSGFMTPETWRSLERLYQAARGIEASGRGAYLESVCGNDVDLRQLLESALGMKRVDGRLVSVFPNDPWPSGKIAGSYQIVQPLTENAAGHTYEAADARSNRTVALKLVRPELAARLEGEGRSFFRLIHPNRCLLFDAGREDGVNYLAMELLGGETLDRRLRKGRLAQDQWLKFAIELCEAVEYAHQHGVVHRDLNPRTILVTNETIKLLDFGVMKSASPAAMWRERALTAAGVLNGTPACMSPEQIQGHVVDERSDIFTLGAILYELAYGEPAFQRPSLHGTLSALLNEDLPAEPGELYPTIGRCLSKRPEERFQNVTEVKRALKRVFAQSGIRAPLTRIGPYNILGELGRGGMGVVYRAEDPGIGRIVAVKTIQLDRFADAAGSAVLRERFLREARSAGSLSHPGIVTVHQLGEYEGQPYIVMEYVDGGSLDRYMPGAANPARPEALIRALRVVASALDYAHSQNIIHRDIKPGNILVSKNGAFKIADFGLVKILREGAHTTTHGLMGTPLYFAPELLRGNAASAQSDQYALGVVAFHIVARKLPYSASSTEELLFQIVAAPPPRASSLNPDLPPGVDAVLQRVLSKDPAQRYGSCREFINALYEALQAPQQAAVQVRQPAPPPPVPAPPPPLPPTPPPTIQVEPVVIRNEDLRPARRSTWIAPLVAGVVAVPIISLAVWQGPRLGRVLHDLRTPTLQPIRLESTPAPYVSALPPAVEKPAHPELPFEPWMVTGPDNPHIEWRAVGAGYLGVEVAGIGGDGTTYLNDYNNIWAIRDGHLKWGYKLDHREDPRPHMALDGRVWFASGIVFNRDGSGGYLRSGFIPLPALTIPTYEPHDDRVRHAGPQFNCVRGSDRQADWHGPGPGLEGADNQGKRWFVPLDHDCVKVQVTHNGDLYASTATKTLYRIDSSGRVLWNYHAACASPVVRLMPSSRNVIVACVEQPLQCVRNGQLLWTFSGGKVRRDLHGRTDVPGVEVDRAGTTYFSDWSIDDPCQLFAVDDQGRLKWKIKLGDIHVDGLQFDREGRLYVSGDGIDGETRGSGVLCLADSSPHTPGRTALAPAIGTVSIHVDPKVQARKLTHRVNPKSSSFDNGTVKLDVVIGADGHVKHVNLIEGYSCCTDAAIVAVKQWIYLPTIMNGSPVEVQTEVDVVFPAGANSAENTPPADPSPGNDQPVKVERSKTETAKVERDSANKAKIEATNALIDGIYHGPALPAMEAALRAGAAPNGVDPDRDPLILAATWCEVDAVKLLLANGADANSPHRSQSQGQSLTPLMTAAIAPTQKGTGDKRCPAVVALLLEHGSLPNQVLGKNTALTIASGWGFTEVARVLLDHQADPNLAAPQGDLPLEAAAKHNSDSTVKLLLERGARADAVGYQGRTPLMAAASGADDYMMKQLLGQGANASRTDAEGMNALSYLLQRNREPNRNVSTEVHTLIQAGASPNVHDSEGVTPLMAVISRPQYPQNVALWQFLIDSGADVNAADVEGRTILIHAVMAYGSRAVELVLAKKANVNARDKAGKTALGYAKSLLDRVGDEKVRQGWSVEQATRRFQELVRLLQNAGAVE